MLEQSGVLGRREKKMSNTHRSDRVAVELMREINDILRLKIRDPRVQDVNISDVQITGDLSQATIYYSLLSDLASDNVKLTHP